MHLVSFGSARYLPASWPSFGPNLFAKSEIRKTHENAFVTVVNQISFYQTKIFLLLFATFLREHLGIAELFSLATFAFDLCKTVNFEFLPAAISIYC